MASSNDLKAALEAQQVKNLTTTDPVTMPGLGLPPKSNQFDIKKYKMRYAKIDFDDMASIAELEILETRALHNLGVHVLSKDRFNFMDKCFLIVGYLEKSPDA